MRGPQLGGGVNVLFDQGTPVPLRSHILGVFVATAYEQGWSRLSNGDLIAAAESAGFDVLVTTDRNLKYQQDLSHRIIAIFVLPTNSWPRLRAVAGDIAAEVLRLSKGDYVEFRMQG
jgi:hypothetical protein